jgi:hypothetical protein
VFIIVVALSGTEMHNTFFFQGAVRVETNTKSFSLREKNVDQLKEIE